jgi:hypothetical protein
VQSVVVLILAITQKNHSTRIPSIKDLLFQHDLRNSILRSLVNQVSQDSLVIDTYKGREVVYVFAHGLGSQGAPLGIFIVSGALSLSGFARGLGQMMNDLPADSILGGCNGEPLHREKP